MNQEPELTWSSGNVFADLGLDDPDLLQTKAELAIAITSIIRERGLTQAAAARELDVDQARISAIVRGRLEDFSLQRLTVLARQLGWDINVGLAPSPEPERQGRMIAFRAKTSESPLAASRGSGKPERARFD
jgi:predicted XRE-type DNA-binding protein